MKALCRAGLVALVLVAGMTAGCGQKGPLYREAPVPVPETGAASGQAEEQP
ncbi:MAG TPA: lipoprotein [Marinobacter sp.]|nr:lipoprotein [Marinobacter sp.]